MAQERIQKQKSRAQDTHTEDSNVDVTNAELAEKTDETLASIDDVLEDQVDDELLADLDDILEENAEEFVSQYVQHGGQ